VDDVAFLGELGEDGAIDGGDDRAVIQPPLGLSHVGFQLIDFALGGVDAFLPSAILHQLVGLAETVNAALGCFVIIDRLLVIAGRHAAADLKLGIAPVFQFELGVIGLRFFQFILGLLNFLGPEAGF